MAKQDEHNLRKAKLFTTGGSQAVRLPAEFRFTGDEVRIRRDLTTGDVILSPVETWDEYFSWAEKQDWPEDFLRDRHQPMDDFVDRSGLRKPAKRRRDHD